MFCHSLISIGSNLGERESYLQSAIGKIANIPNTNIIKKSIILNTKALEYTNQPDFLNAIIKISTKHKPMELLKILQSIEKKIGKVKRFDKGPREIDLDILTYSNEVIKTQELTIPHHSLYTRPFIKELLVNMGEESVYDSFK